jgi:tetratricopeptide (TPR) repeat protein
MGKNLDEAEKLILKALELEPNDGFFIDSLGWVYYQKGDYKRAVSELERAVSLVVDDPTIIEHLGDAYEKLGRQQEALDRYRRALKRVQEEDQSNRIGEKIQLLERRI